LVELRVNERLHGELPAIIGDTEGRLELIGNCLDVFEDCG